MKYNLLLTGKPGIGKTTIIIRLVEILKDKLRIGGFYTYELRKNNIRTGFMIRTLDGKEALLASKSFKSNYKVGKYSVNIKAIDNVMVPSILESLEKDLIIIDEIGKMELFSENFKTAVLKALAKRKVLGTIMLKSNEFVSKIKARNDVKVILVNEKNRDSLAEEIIKEISP